MSEIPPLEYIPNPLSLRCPSTLRPRWVPIGVYRTCSLPPLPLPKPTPRVKWVHPDKRRKGKDEGLNPEV